MTARGSLDPHDYEQRAPHVSPESTIRFYGDEAVVWSADATPVHLGPVGSVLIQLLDGGASIGELADDIVAEIGVPRSIALSQLRANIGLLDDAGVLEIPSAQTGATTLDRFFYGPENP